MKSIQTMVVVAAALVALSAQPADGRITGEVLSEPGGEGVADAVVELWDSWTGYRERTQTDPDGRYRFERFEPATYALRLVERPDGVWSEGVVVEFDGQPLTAEPLNLELPQSVGGTVRDIETGEAVAGATINFSTENRNRAAIRTDPEGRYRVFVTPREVDILSQGTPDRFYPAEPAPVVDEGSRRVVSVDPDEHVTDVDFAVRSAPSIAGRVLLPDEQPAADVPVYVKVMWSRMSTQDQELIDAHRRRWPERSVREPHEPRVGPAEIRIEGRFDSGGIGRNFQVTTGADGRFHVYLRRPTMRERDEVLAIVAIVRTDDLALGASDVLLTTTLDPDPRPLLVRLAATGSAVFQTVDPAGDPVDAVEPSAAYFEPARNTGMSPPVPMVDPAYEPLGEGRFRATGLVDGWKYRFYASGDGHRQLFERLDEVEVGPGEEIDAGVLTLRWWDARLVPELLEHLADDNRYRRESAARLLGELGAESAAAVPALIERLHNDDVNSVRFTVAEALGRIGPPARPAVPALIEALQRDDGGGVQREAATALGRLGDRRALPALRRAAEHPDRDVRQAAEEAIEQLEAPQLSRPPRSARVRDAG